MRLYLDICAIQRPLDDQTQLRIRAEAAAVLGLLSLCETGTIELVASGVHLIENQKNPDPDLRTHVEDVLSLARTYVHASAAVLQCAQQFESLGIRRFDALHLASAIEAGAAYFCTTDDRLIRKGKAVNTGGVSVVSPLELVMLLT